MVSAKWVHGEGLEPVFKIREEVFVKELEQSNEAVKDDYDNESASVLLSELRVPVGTGRLIIKNGEFTIDKLCVLKDNRGKNYAELIIRMLVRKAYDSGAKKTLVTIKPNLRKIFEKIGFEEIEIINDEILMAKYGDVGGHCC